MTSDFGRSQESGQATIAALVILPVALAISVTLFILGLALAIEARAVSACRESMRQSQEIASEALANLERLNPVARNLERLRWAAELKLKMARISLNPPLIAAAYASRLIVDGLQRPVQAKQKYWYLRGKAASAAAPFKALQAMEKSLPKGRLGRWAQRLLMSPPRIRSARFQMIQTPPGARTPVYRPAPLFSRTQNARVQWLLSLPVEHADDGAWIPKLQIGCEMTLIKGTFEKWRPKITEDKLSPN